MRVQENYKYRIKTNRAAPENRLPTYESDDFFVLNSNKIELVLSYNFKLRKQGGKSFFRRVWTYFFLKSSFKKDRFVFPEKKPVAI